MSAIRTVLLELYKFVFFEFFGLRSKDVRSETLYLSNGATFPIIRDAAGNVANTDELYVAVPHTLVHTEPGYTFDNVVGKFLYGTKVRKVEISESGRWIKVEGRDLRGWILREDVVETPRVLVPKLTIGTRYDASHTETIKLRTAINDEFHAHALELDLQDVEYAVYRLKQKNRTIRWSTVRPRLAGTWHELLKGAQGIHIGVAPAVDTVMEYVNEEGVGHVAVVEAVFPGDVIHLSEVGHPEEGIYNERTLEHEEWRELRPVFISMQH